MKYSKEIKIGLLAIVAGLMLYFGVRFLKGSDFFSNNKTYYAIYDRVDGLTISNPVILKGLIVGRVRKIEVLADQGYKLKVTMDIRDDLVLGKNSVAMLADNGLLGGKAIVLQMGKVTEALPNRSEIKGAIQGSLLAEAQESAMPLLQRLDSITQKVDNLLAELAGSGTKINNTLSNVEGMSASVRAMLKDNRGNLQALTNNLRLLSANILEDERQLRPILLKTDEFMSSLNELELQKLETAIDNANKTLTELNVILEDVNQGKGTLGALAKDDSLYLNLANLTENLDKLVIDLRENPQRYIKLSVFGKKDKEEKE